jgi:hypothetical protein
MAKHKYIETPERLMELFNAYKADVKTNPIIKNDFAGKDADEVYKKLERPLTMEGFECHVFEQGLNSDLSHYFMNKDDRYSEYVAICSHIRRMIRRDQIEGGMAGIYNPSITQRLNNLVEKIQEDGSKELIIKVKYDNKGADHYAE